MKKSVFILMISVSAIAGIVFGSMYAENANIHTANNENVIDVECEIAYSGLDNVLDEADYIVRGVVTDIRFYDTYEEYDIQVNADIKGDAQGNITIKNNYYNYGFERNGQEYSGQTNRNYKIDTEYIFVLQHIYNVYEDVLVLLSDIYVPVRTSEESMILSQNAYDLEGIQDIAQYIIDYEEKNSNIKGSGDEISIDYIISDDIYDLVKGSAYIATISVKELWNETDVSDVYLCEVKSVIKGDMTVMDGNQILLPFFKASVQENEEYVVLLNSDTDDSYIYSLSSKNSVRTLEEIQSIISLVNTGGME